MPLETYLMDGESILAQGGCFYASDRRLIRYRKRFLGEELDDIPYSHLTSIGIVRSRKAALLKGGITITLIGLSTFLTLLVVEPILKSVSGILGSLMGFDLGSLLSPLIPFSIIITFVGIALLALWFFMASTFIEFRAPGLSKDAEAKFRLEGIRNEASLNLVRVVREQSFKAKGSESPDVPARESKGNQAAGQ